MLHQFTEMNDRKGSLPANSVLNAFSDKYNYIDSFQSAIHDVSHQLTSTHIGKAFFTSGPQWVGGLFVLRNKVVSVLGLKTSGKITDRQRQLDKFKCEPGEQLGLFKVFDKTDNEVILGEDDKHLSFRVSLFLSTPIPGHSERIITISTVVTYNNWFGRLYFLPVKPFHKVIVPAMLKEIVRQLGTILRN